MIKSDNLKKFFATIFVFMFVLAWHGTTANYIYWVLLSSFELFIENIGAFIRNTYVWNNFTKFIGEKNERRIISIALILTVLPGKRILFISLL